MRLLSWLIDQLPTKTRISNVNRFLTSAVVPGFEPIGCQDQLVFCWYSPYDQFYENWTKWALLHSGPDSEKRSVCDLRLGLHFHLFKEDSAAEVYDGRNLTCKREPVDLKRPPYTFSGRNIGDCCWATPHHNWQIGQPLYVTVLKGNFNFTLGLSGEEATPELIERIALDICAKLETWIPPASWKKSVYSAFRVLLNKVH